MNDDVLSQAAGRCIARNETEYASAAAVAAFSVAATLVFACIAGSATAEPLRILCDVPNALLTLNGRLDTTLSRLKSHAPLRVLAIGSSSTEGVGASSPQAAYPARLQTELQNRFKNQPVEVVNRGVSGEVVTATAERLRTEVEALKPSLVVWQVGTNDALRGVSSEVFADTLRNGLGWLAERRIDVVLMDPQFFPKVAGSSAYASYVDGISTLAEVARTPVLHRYAAMRYWSDRPEGVRTPMLAADGFHMNDQGHACVGAMLAEAILRRTEPREPAVAGGAGALPQVALVKPGTAQ